MRYLLFFFILIIVAFVTADLFLKEPAIWSDEVALGTEALRVLKSPTYVLVGTYPLMIYLLAIWFKLVDFSVVNQRLFSLFVGIGFIIVYYFFSRSFFKDKWVAILSVSALVLDLTFLKATRVSRPEILVLFWGTLSLFFVKSALEQKDKEKLTYILLSVGGVCATLAFFTHPIGFLFAGAIATFFLLSEGKKIWRSPRAYILVVSIILPLLLWVVPMFPYVKSQLLTGMSVKSFQQPWLVLIFQNQIWEFKLVYLIYIIASLFYILFVILNRQVFPKDTFRQYIYLAIILVFSWAFPLFANEFWYFVYPIPFIYLAINILFASVSSRKLNLAFLGMLVLVVFLNIDMNWRTLKSLGGDNYSYNFYTEAILKLVPDGKSVFISAIPDPSYGFISRNRSNKLVPFPSYSVSQEDYAKRLADIDYVIFTGAYDSSFAGNFLVEYLMRNKANIQQINTRNQYSASIIELKPKDQRQGSF